MSDTSQACRTGGRSCFRGGSAYFGAILCVVGLSMLAGMWAVGGGGPPARAATVRSGRHVTKAIEDVEAGDRVMAFDATTGSWHAETVLKPQVHDYTGDMVAISVNGQTIHATGNHPFWVAAGSGLFGRQQSAAVYPQDRQAALATGNGRWIDARDLQAGDELALVNGTYAPIEEVQIGYARQKVYNMQVADLHTYAVSDAGVAVHNRPCFPPGTLILMGDGSTKPIEDVKLGDTVLAGDLLSTGPPRPAKVTGLIRDFSAHIVTVIFRSPARDRAQIIATRCHPFWTKNRGWVDAKDLYPADILQTIDGSGLAVIEIRVRPRLGLTYNLEVEKFHDYYALADDQTSVLVHNAVISWQFGDFDKLTSASEPGDGLMLHHYPQFQPASETISGYTRAKGLAVAVPDAQHMNMNATNYNAGEFTGDTQQLVDESYANIQCKTQIPADKLNALDAEARSRYLTPPSP